MDTGDKAYLGSIKTSVAVPSFEIKGKARIAEFRRQMRVAHEKGLNDGVKILRTILLGKKYFDTGKLSNSVARKLFIKSTEVFLGDVHFNEPGKEYAYFVEHGRGAGLPPPIAKMKAWGKRKGLTFEHTMAIRAKIARVGTQPRPFMAKAEEKIQTRYNAIVDKAVERFRKNIK
jgi:hypothetical protein